ncbi:MAG: L,D-transpeptidase [Polyangiaceae bacterium]|nr:L,D-transpeptidase [Polyangiaceae bacterium]
MSERRALGFLTALVAFTLNCSGLSPEPRAEVEAALPPSDVGGEGAAAPGTEAPRQTPPKNLGVEAEVAAGAGAAAQADEGAEAESTADEPLDYLADGLTDSAAADDPSNSSDKLTDKGSSAANLTGDALLEDAPEAAKEPAEPNTQLVRLSERAGTGVLGVGTPEPALTGAPTQDVEPDPEHALVALRYETFVFERPSWRARKIGYLRAGARLRRSPEPHLTSKDCKGGWYQVEPQGFVCAGNTATTDLTHPVAVAARVRPDRSSGLPYAYGLAKYPPPPLYTKLPSKREQARVEPDGRRGGAPGFLLEAAPPSFLQGGAQSPNLSGAPRAASTVYSGRALGRSGFAFLSLFEHEGRPFGLTTELSVLPLDRLRPVPKTEFRGIPITGEGHVAFNRSSAAALYSGSPREGLKEVRLLRHREAVELTGEAIGIGSARYLKTLEGYWLRDTALTHITPMKKVPGWAKEGRTWIDVSILKQTLVAYVGTRPVFATLVSTGADGLGDPEKTRSTVQGQFLIHTKHVTAKMSGDEPGDEFDLKDVPYVQYFNQGYAFHAAYWHDGFGRPRSHGCINLAPEDARWLFQFTDPPVPQRWHGAMATGGGTLVHIHP